MGENKAALTDKEQRLMKKYQERIMKGVFFAAASVSVLAVILICLFLLINGLPVMGKIGVFDFLLGRTWRPNNVPPAYGIFPMILGSIYVTVGAVAIGVPLGLLTAVFMARYCSGTWYRFLKPAINLLAGIPSVVYGFFGLVVIVPLIRDVFGGTGSSMLAAAILLGIMILPTITSVSEAVLRAVPQNYYEGGLALGASHERTIFYILLPAAKSGIMAAVVLGIGRAIGETMAVIMVAGNQARMPAGLRKGVRTLTANIVIEMGYAVELHRGALIATAVVLFFFILLINSLLSWLKRRAV